MVHCCEEYFFEIAWAQQVQKIAQCLLHDLSNYLTGSLALSELYCINPPEIAAEKFALIRDNCYKEREILGLLSQLHHAHPGNISYISLSSFIKDLYPFFIPLLPAHTKFTLNHTEVDETLVKLDTALLQRVFLLTVLLAEKTLKNEPTPELSFHISRMNQRIVCKITIHTSFNLEDVDLDKINTGTFDLPQIYGPMVRFYCKKCDVNFTSTLSAVQLSFPIAK